MLFLHRLENHCEAFFENIGDEVFVANADVFQVERFGVTVLGTNLAPFRGFGITVGPFDQVKNVLNVLVHVTHGNPALLAWTSDVGILARYACCNDGQRLSTNVFAILKKFLITQTTRLMVVPDVAQGFAGFQRTDGVLPFVDIAQTVAVRNTTARKADKTGMNVGNHLSQVFSKAVFTPHECILWKQ